MAENTSYAPDQSKHYLELNSAEQSLLEQAEATFDNVIVLINSGNAMELGFLNDEGVDAASGSVIPVMWARLELSTF